MKNQSDFGKGLVICLVKFAEHLENDQWERIVYTDSFLRIGDKKKIKDYDRNVQLAMEYYDLTLSIWKTKTKWFAHAIEMWANGATDHLYEMEYPKSWKGTKLARKIDKLISVGLRMGHGWDDLTKIWTVEDILKLKDWTREIALEIDKKLKLKPEMGAY